MRCYDQGALFRVTVDELEVYNFKQTFPCSGLPTSGVSFTFDKSNGDIVDLAPHNMDGPGVLALMDDAKAYGAKKLGLDL